MKNLENSWKGRKNMNADMKWLDNPEVFRVNQLEAHSDHCYYLDYSDMKGRSCGNEVCSRCWF